MPWPRLKMWPGRPARALEDTSVAGEDPSSGPRSSVGSRLPWIARSCADRAPRLRRAACASRRRSRAAGLALLAEDRCRCRCRSGSTGTPVGSAIEDAARVGQDVLAVVVRVQRADPRVEQLHGLDAGLDLRARGSRRTTRRACSQNRATARVRRTSAPWCARSARVAAFDRVARQRERRAGEADERHAAVELALRSGAIAWSTCASPSRGFEARSRSMSASRRGSARGSPAPRPSRTRTACPSARAGAGYRRRGSPRPPRCAARGCSVTSVASSGVLQMSSSVCSRGARGTRACSGRPGA